MLPCTVIIYNINFRVLTNQFPPFAVSLSDLENFIQAAKTGLGKNMAEGDYGGLVEVMGHLLAVKERQSSTDEMFEPLQHTIDLLKTYEQELPEVVYKQLEVL